MGSNILYLNIPNDDLWCAGLISPAAGGCREGSLPDIISKIGTKLAQTLGEC